MRKQKQSHMDKAPMPWVEVMMKELRSKGYMTSMDPSPEAREIVLRHLIAENKRARIARKKKKCC
jgi:hypothetical protein